MCCDILLVGSLMSVKTLSFIIMIYYDVSFIMICVVMYLESSLNFNSVFEIV